MNNAVGFASLYPPNFLNSHGSILVVRHARKEPSDWAKLPAPERIQGSSGDALYIRWMPPKLRWLPCLLLVIANLVVLWYFEIWPMLGGVVLFVFVAVNTIALLIILRFALGRTLLERSDGQVLIKRGPLLWPRTFRVSYDQLESVDYSAGDFAHGHRRTAKVYKIVAATREGSSIWLVKHLSSWRSAIRIRDANRSYLKLETDEKDS